MKYTVLIIILVLSVFIVGCSKNVPTTTDTSTTPNVVDQTSASQPSDNSMPPPPPAEPSIVPGETVN
jgi:PBP1b-binding outer membrane lipoprotein LpoB